MYNIDPNEYDIEAIRRRLVSEIGPATPIEEMANASLVSAETCSPDEVIMMAIEYNIDIEEYRKYTR